MIALTLLTAVQAVAPAPADEVTVIGRRLDTWRGAIRTTKAGTTCITKSSTGDPEIDRIGCTVMTECWPETRTRMQAAQVKGLTRAERKRLADAAAQAFITCGKPKREAMIDALAERRLAGTGA